MKYALSVTFVYISNFEGAGILHTHREIINLFAYKATLDYFHDETFFTTCDDD